MIRIHYIPIEQYINNYKISHWSDKMPYIRIKAYPKDEETKKKVVEEINDIFLKYWGCPQEALCISLEEVEPEKWNESVREVEILPNKEKMMIFDGKKQYE